MVDTKRPLSRIVPVCLFFMCSTNWGESWWLCIYFRIIAWGEYWLSMCLFSRNWYFGENDMFVVNVYCIYWCIRKFSCTWSFDCKSTNVWIGIHLKPNFLVFLYVVSYSKVGCKRVIHFFIFFIFLRNKCVALLISKKK